MSISSTWHLSYDPLLSWDSGYFNFVGYTISNFTFLSKFELFKTYFKTSLRLIRKNLQKNELIAITNTRKRQQRRIIRTIEIILLLSLRTLVGDERMVRLDEEILRLEVISKHSTSIESSTRLGLDLRMEIRFLIKRVRSIGISVRQRCN